ncbi:MAG: histidine phosphatase family protein [Gemmatimonadaceae bacterium]|nr:histidine phosphatase family protein [Gemmatimonadaceae bacterium]
MQLLVIRHAIAMTREAFASIDADDARRPLTHEGRRKMAAGAKGLCDLVPSLDVLASSPFVRAHQTAVIVAECFGEVPIVTTSALEPDTTPGSFLTWLHSLEGDVVAVVGHEPHLGMLVTWLLTGLEDSRLPLKKGGACLLDLAARPRKGEAMLRWALTPSQLRRIGR